MNLHKRLFSITASAALVLSAVTAAAPSAAFVNIPDIDNVNVQDYEITIPEWVPTTYIDALNFTNEYGMTHIEDEFICLVQHCSKSEKEYNNITFKKSRDDGYIHYYFKNDLYLENMDIPLPPDKEKNEKAYDEYMDKYGKYSLDPDDMKANDYYKVIVFSPSFTDIDVTVESGRYVNDEVVITDSVTYQFGYTTSFREQEHFDAFRFLPDCTKEYNEFIKKYGTVSIHDDYVVYCDDVLYAAGSDLEVENSAPDKLKEVMSYTITANYPLGIFTPVGGADHVVKVYRAQEKGDATLKFTNKTSSDVRDYDKVISKNYHIEELETYNNRINFRIIENTDDLPEWVPSDFSEAMAFDTKYGATHIEDNYVCCVRRISGSTDEYEEYIYDWNITSQEDSHSQISKKHYTPDTVQAGNGQADISYDVELFRLEPSTLLDVTWNKSPSNYFNYQGDTCKYSFSSNEDGTVTETDVFGWLPDSVTEVQDYKKNKGMISVNDDLIVYCNTINAGTGYSMDVGNKGISHINPLVEYSFEDPQLVPVDGGKVAKVTLYQATKPGTATMTFTYGRSFEPDDKKQKTVQSFRFDNDLKAEMIDEDDLPPLISGDCNYDGAVGMSDYVTLRKWLQSDGALECAENADMNKDGSIDVFDLIAMKKLLINGNTVYSGLVSDPKPMLVAVYNNNAWGLRQDIWVYDENGICYSMSLNTSFSSQSDTTYEERISMSTDRDWYGSIVDVMKNGKIKDEYCMPDDLVSRTRTVAANIAEYSKVTGGKSRGASFDAGITTYYIVGSDSEGKPVFMNICGEGDVVSVSNCKEIKEYVRYATYDDFFMSPYAFSMLEKYGD